MAPSPLHSSILDKWGVPKMSSSAPSAQIDQVQDDQQASSPITSEEADTSFGSGDSNDTSLNTAESSETDSSDREAVTDTILGVLTSHPQISITLIEWARIFIEEEPQMLGRSSTICEAQPNAENMRIEFEKGVRAICRVCSDDRLKEVRDSVLELQNEWTEASANGSGEPDCSEYMDLMYTEATCIVEEHGGEFRDPSDVELIGAIFGFANGGHDAGEMTEEGDGDEEVSEATEQSLETNSEADAEVNVAGEDVVDSAGQS